jgi:signal transduction histidine kinase
VAYIRRYVVGYFEPTDIRVRISIPPEIPPMQISGDFRRAVFLVVKESLHNIMKHAKATEIMLEVEADNGLQIKLRDNGRGFNDDEVKLFSNGLRSMRERMENIGGNFTVTGKNGTEVTLSLPV